MLQSATVTARGRDIHLRATLQAKEAEQLLARLSLLNQLSSLSAANPTAAPQPPSRASAQAPQPAATASGIHVPLAPAASAHPQPRAVPTTTAKVKPTTPPLPPAPER